MWTCQVLGHHDTKAVHRKNTEQQKTTRRTEHQDATDIQKTHTHYFKCFSDFFYLYMDFILSADDLLLKYMTQIRVTTDQKDKALVLE